MKRYGVIGIDIESLRGEFGLKALKKSGNNFGNMLFTSAVYNQIQNCSHLGFNFNPEKIREEYDGLVIPAANWVNIKQDWGFLADLLEKANLPVCVIGLGSQINSERDFDAIPNGTKRLLKVLSDISSRIGVRGEYTKSVLERLGVGNCEVLGCPSIFMKNRIPDVRPVPNSGSIRVGIGPTRYAMPKDIKGGVDKQRDLYRYAFRSAASIYYQSEAFEIACMNREGIGELINNALEYYDVESPSVLIDGIMRIGKYHKDIDQWIMDAKKDDLYVGTRIHGAIAAILSGTPAVLITHDNRTSELSESMGIPSIGIDDFSVSDLEDLHQFCDGIDFLQTERYLKNHISKFKRFYESNGIVSNLCVL